MCKGEFEFWTQENNTCVIFDGFFEFSGVRFKDGFTINIFPDNSVKGKGTNEFGSYKVEGKKMFIHNVLEIQRKYDTQEDKMDRMKKQNELLKQKIKDLERQAQIQNKYWECYIQKLELQLNQIYYNE
jgi:hypothetical protein